MKNTILLSLFLFFFSQIVSAQDTAERKIDYKNTVRFNLTNPMIFGGRSLVFGYERLLNDRSSFSINVGPTSFPAIGILNTDSIQARSTLSDKGFSISGDYRFYLLKENKYKAPRGIYIGPYFSYNYFEKTNSWQLKSTNGGNSQIVETETSLAVAGIGVEMGYQFIFWNRVTLDCLLIGPGVANYNLESKLAVNLSEEDKHKFFEKLNEALEDKLPGFGRVIDEDEYQAKGTSKATKLGYRYMVMIGFRF